MLKSIQPWLHYSTIGDWNHALTDFFLLVVKCIKLSLCTYCLLYVYFIHLNEISFETVIWFLLLQHDSNLQCRNLEKYLKRLQNVYRSFLCYLASWLKRMRWYRWYYNSVISFINQFVNNRSVYQITAYSI